MRVDLRGGGHVPMSDVPDDVVAAILATTARAVGSGGPIGAGANQIAVPCVQMTMRGRSRTGRRALAVVVTTVVAVVASGCGGDVDVARSEAPRQDATADDARAAGEVVNTLAASLYAPLAAGGEANLVYSPASIGIALSMLRTGASGASAEQLDTLLGTDDPDQLQQAFNSLDQALDERSGERENADGESAEVALSSANSLWAQDGAEWEEPFLDALARYYDAGVRQVDFADAPAARDAINGWVADNTEDKISELIPADALSAATKLVLVNALYAKAPWDTAFDDVGERDFTTADGQVQQAPAMTAQTTMPYQAGDGWQAVAIPYAGGELAMTLLVPDAGAFDAVEGSLDGALLGTILANEQTAMVDLQLPKFDLRTTTTLSETLAGLGVTAPFDPRTTDFAPMSSDPDVVPLVVSEVRHEATITVDEEGTEAAAATSVEMDTGAAPPDDNVELIVDRPFVFVLHDVATATPLFVGRVTDPLA
ncbi:serpin family protein [Jiangella asiatica]|uniref:Serpin family protein n=1 Tax=Jiangella asiatica TaxID=2530372 RepID=A0A4R5DEB1_9ACTN|nr:serpin family protein [Jiangella asiatica]TDE12212.1 serpin family protein [Jiangella asiatica]